MAVNADNLMIAGNFHAFVGPTTTTAPVHVDDALDAGFADVGFTTRDGTTLKPNNPKDPIYGHQSAFPIRYVPGDRDFVVVVQMMEWNETSLGLWLGGSEGAADGTGFMFEAPDPSLVDTRSWVLDLIDGDNRVRIYLPAALVVDSGESQAQQKATGLLPITLGTTQTDVSIPAYTIWTDFSGNADPDYP